MNLTHFSLFSGIGGMDLAAEWAGFKTIGQVEIADYPYKVLCKHWPDVPKWRDIRDVTGESFRETTGIKSPKIISGGFPCQPFSTAGKRRGKEDDRYLWHEMFRIIKELRPDWVIGENVAGYVQHMELDTSLANLESEGYTTRAFCIPAVSVEADHERKRVFIVAHSGYMPRGSEQECKQEIPKESFGSGYRRVYPDTKLLEPQCCENGRTWRQWKPIQKNRDWTATNKPRVVGVHNGIPNRLDRCRALGNAVVPQQVYPIFRAITEIENGQSD